MSGRFVFEPVGTPLVVSVLSRHFAGRIYATPTDSHTLPVARITPPSARLPGCVVSYLPFPSPMIFSRRFSDVSASLMMSFMISLIDLISSMTPIPSLTEMIPMSTSPLL